MGSEQVRQATRISSASSSARRRIKVSTKGQEAKTDNVLAAIIKTRKAWKTIRGGEVVWPPELEAALLEGLAMYQPDNSRETRLLGRFPMRNRFISDHIFAVTGIRRTAKQVGSRLQQLRDTYHDTDLMKLLQPLGPLSLSARKRIPAHQDDSSSASSYSSPETPLDELPPCGPSKTIIHIDILDPKASPLATRMDLPLMSDDNIIRTSSKPRHLSEIDPTVTFIAPASVSAQSSWTVYKQGTLVFSEATLLTSHGPAPADTQGKCLYRTTIVPGFWKRIVESSDPTDYTIVQEVCREGPSTPSTIFSAVYKFNYPPSADDFIDAIFSDSGLDSVESSSSHDPLSTLPLDSLITMDPLDQSYDDDSFYETCRDFLAVSDRSWSSSPEASVDFSWSYSERAPSDNGFITPTMSPGPICYSPPPVSYSPMLSEY